MVTVALTIMIVSVFITMIACRYCCVAVLNVVPTLVVTSILVVGGGAGGLFSPSTLAPIREHEKELAASKAQLNELQELRVEDNRRWEQEVKALKENPEYEKEKAKVSLYANS